MDNIKYRYSAWTSYQIFGAILVIGIGFPAFMIISNLKDQWAWYFFGSLVLSSLAAIYFWYKKLYIHIINKDLALELDSEKLTYYAKSRVIYWKDITNIYYDRGIRNNSYTISFSMNDPDNDMRIITGYIEGSDKDILDTIYSYFEKYKQ